MTREAHNEIARHHHAPGRESHKKEAAMIGFLTSLVIAFVLLRLMRPCAAELQ